MPFDFLIVGQSVESLAKTIAALTTIGAAASVVVVKARRHLGFITTSLEQLSTLPASIQKLETDLTSVKYQLHPNGGASVSDRIGVIGRDVAGIYEDLNALRNEFQARLEATAHAMNDYMLHFDEMGHCNFVNRALLSACGGVARDYFGLGWANLIVDAIERDRVLNLWRQAHGMGSNFECHAHIFDPTGPTNSILGELIFIPWTTKNQTVIGWTGTITPIKGGN